MLHRLLPLSILLLAFDLHAADSPAYHSSYAGENTRQIKSLSEYDIEQLKNGRGWGLAKAAELNGVPGPAHLLQMKREIQLSADQETQISQLFTRMQQQAIPLGKQLIQLEQELNESFAKHTVTEVSLRQKLDEIAQVTKELRYVHLATHLATPGILSQTQIEAYNRLRGYSNDAPCASVPEGHDPTMWKQHNHCQ